MPDRRRSAASGTTATQAPSAGTTASNTTASARTLPRLLTGLGLALILTGCTAIPGLRRGSGPADLPLPPGITVAFNQRSDHRYRSPISGRWRQGDDLEAFVIQAIREARQEVLVAVQELSLPGIAEALVAQRQRGLRVRVVLENTYSQPWSALHPADLEPHQRHRVEQLRALGLGDAVAILQRGHVPILDDTADGSAGSGLMHHKFVVVDRRLVVTGSANFSPSCIHGDPDDPLSRGNVNHLLRFSSAPLAALFAAEFDRMWGDGPGGATDSRFGLAKEEEGAHTVQLGATRVTVLFAPHHPEDPRQGLRLLAQWLSEARQRVDLALFVFSAQGLADTLQHLQQRGVVLRLLSDPGFAYRSYSEVLDLLGLSMADRRCRLETGQQAWNQPLTTIGIPRLAPGDKLHHKLAVIDDRTVITGSFNWSPSAAHQNDETLLRIESPALAAHMRREVDRLWRGAELGITPRLQRRLARTQLFCGRGRPRPA